MRSIGSACGLVGFVIVLAGCNHVIAPPAAPAAAWPPDIELRTTPPETGKTRIALDANGEHASVLEVTQHKDASAWSGRATIYATEETTQPVCLTPCVVDLPPGMHVLRAQVLGEAARHDDFLVQIGDQSKVVRHTVGRKESHVALRMLGVIAVSAVATLVPGGGALWALDDSPASAATGRALFFAGLVSAVVAVPLLVLGRTDVQAGSTTQFPWR